MSYGTGTRPTVLLIEADASLRRLIALGLQYRGMHVIDASSLTSLIFTGSPASTASTNFLTVETQPPVIIVLDVDGDGDANCDRLLLETVQEHPMLSTIPVVILAWECPIQAEPQLACFTKPFDARLLHKTIEQLLVDSAYTKEASPQAHLLAPQTTTSAPSIWPLITAAGLLLAFIGLMGQLICLILGACIVMASLLLWTLGTSTRREVYRVYAK